MGHWHDVFERVAKELDAEIEKPPLWKKPDHDPLGELREAMRQCEQLDAENQATAPTETE